MNALGWGRTVGLMSAFKDTFHYDHQSRARGHQPVVRAVPARPTGTHGYPFDGDAVVPLARKATSCAEILFELGVPRDSWYFRKLAYTAWLFGIELPLNEGKPSQSPAWKSAAALRTAFAVHGSMQDVCEHFGVSPCGATYKRIRAAAVDFGIELPGWACTRLG